MHIAHLIRKIDVWGKNKIKNSKGLSDLNNKRTLSNLHQILSRNFANNKTYYKNIIDNPKYCGPLVIFQRYKKYSLK
jgi:hypothetical protein